MEPVTGLALERLATKLKRSRIALKSRKKTKFKKVDQHIVELEERLAQLDDRFHTNYSPKFK